MKLELQKISVRKFPGFLRVTAGSPVENRAFLSVLKLFVNG